MDKVLKQDCANVKESVRKIFYASTYEHTLEAVELFKKNWSRKYPSVTECLLEDIVTCLTYYKYPYWHRQRIRTTNVAERGFIEVKRRSRGVGRFQGKERVLTMVYWQLKELKWHAVRITGEAKAIFANLKALKIGKVAA